MSTYHYIRSAALGGSEEGQTITATVVDATGTPLVSQPTPSVVDLGGGIFGVSVPDMDAATEGWVVLKDGATVLAALPVDTGVALAADFLDRAMTFRDQRANYTPTYRDALQGSWFGPFGQASQAADGSATGYSPTGYDPDVNPPGATIVEYGSNYVLLGTGAFDALGVADPGDPSNWTSLDRMLLALCRRFLGSVAKTFDPATGVGTIALKSAIGATNATQTISADRLGNETQGEMT